MNSSRSTLRLSKRVLAQACALLAVSLASAQQTKQDPVRAAQDAQALAKYDKNKNGKLDADERAMLAADEASAAAAQGDVLLLTPFQVDSSRDKGYAAENTLAGSRLNSKLEDLAASITVVTKQQLEDTASLDINDVFRYEAGTEGSSSYTPVITDRGTAKDTIAGYTFGNDGTTTTNAQSNRIRGLGSPDAAIEYFPTSSRVPFDSYNTQSVEISRGPNALLFGLGTPAGIVNQSLAKAVLNRDTNQVQLRTDQYGSFRTSLSVNRSIIRDKLAVYGAFLYNDQKFQRKPSGELTRRQYGAITYKPFSKTFIRGFAENYLNDANRPNSLTPRDFVTPWLQSGRPTYDPITRMVTVLDTGRVVGPVVITTASPGYVATVNGQANPANTSAITTSGNPWYTPGITFLTSTRPELRVDNGGFIDYFARQPVFYPAAQTNPVQATPTAASLGWTAGSDPRYAIMDRQFSASAGLLPPVPTVNGLPGTYGNYQVSGVTNKSIYDWTKYNTLQANFSRLHASNYNLEFEHEILPKLFFSAAWLRQDIDSTSNNTLNQLTGATVVIDTNKNMINGQPNPYFGLPFIPDGPGGTDTFYQPETDDNFRVLLTYDLDMTRNRNWTRWLGRHRLLGLWSEQDQIAASERWRLAVIGGDADGTLRYVPNLLSNPANNLWNDQAFERAYYLAKPGDPQARVTQSSGSWGNQGWNKPFNAPIQVWNYTTGQFQTDNVIVNNAFSDANSAKTQREVKTTNFSMQSFLWEDRLVATLGWRHDDYRARKTTTGAITKADGTAVAPALLPADIFHYGNGYADYNLVMNRWNRWDKLTGNTKTIGGAFRPLKGMGFAQRFGGEGSTVSEFLQSLTFYLNQSDNFNPPAAFQTDFFNKPLPKPTGKDKEIGVGFNLFRNKLVARVNWFETINANERTAAATTLLTRLVYGDSTLMVPWATAVVRLRHGADTNVALWNDNAVNPVTSTALQTEIWNMVKLPINYYAGQNVTGTQQSKAKGVELNLTYNPLPNWTMKLTGSKNEATYTQVAPEYDAWLAARMPVWVAATAPDMVDFTDINGTAYSLRNFWTGYGYTTAARITNADGSTNSANYFTNTVVSQVALAKALEGAVSPLQRIYHASFLTNYTFTRNSFGGKLTGFALGGSERWESKAAIGFFGKVGNPLTQPTTINLNDVNRPVYDKGNYYTDLWISYSRKIYSDKVGLKLQLNVNNAMESGGLQPIGVNFDGTPWAYRIIDPRQFVLTATFSF